MPGPLQPLAWVLAYTALLLVRPHEYVPALAGIPLLPIVLGGAALLWALRTPKRMEAPQYGLMLMLWVASGLSWLANGWYGGAVDALGRMLPIVLLFWFAAGAIDAERDLRRFMLVFVVCLAWIAWHGIEQAASADGVGWTGAAMINGRITYIGFLNDPNDLAMALLMAFPMALRLASIARFLVVRLAYYCAAAGMLWAVYLCNSRGSMVALGAMAVAYLYARFGTVVSALVTPIVLLPLSMLGPSRIADMSDDEDSAAGRLDAWYEGVQMLASNPLFGVGFGGFTEHHPLTAHNSFVLAFAELGMFGYFAWLSIIVLTAGMLRDVYRAARAQMPPNHTAVTTRLGGHAAALGYALLAALVCALFLSRSFIAILYLLMAAAVALHRIATRELPGVFPVRLMPRLPMLTALAIGSVVVIWLGTRILIS